MKALTCEMCGSTNLIKKDGVFVCQSCGTQYSVEEAKKMMVEGTVVIDKSKDIENWLTLARNAISANNDQEAYDYANKILEIDSQLAEAWIIKMRGAAGIGTNGNPRAEEIINAGKNAISFDKSKQEEVACFFLETAIVLLKIASHMAEDDENIQQIYMSNFQLYGKQNAINQCVSIDQSTISMLENLGNSAFALEKAAAETEIFKDNEKMQSLGADMLYRYSMYGFNVGMRMLHYWSPLKEPFENKIKMDKESILNDLPMEQKRRAEIEEDKRLHPEKYKTPKTSGGCYVATAVYGSYDCPQVWTLRRYRDNTLAETWFGRAFIKTYYAISPTMVKWFGGTSWFKSIGRKLLDKKVKKLNEDGVADTRYYDKLW